jgi:hypothetical protein
MANNNETSAPAQAEYPYPDPAAASELQDPNNPGSRRSEQLRLSQNWLNQARADQFDGIPIPIEVFQYSRQRHTRSPTAACAYMGYYQVHIQDLGNAVALIEAVFSQLTSHAGIFRVTMLALNRTRSQMLGISNRLPPTSPHLRSLYCSVHIYHRRHWEIASQQRLDAYTARLRDQFRRGDTAVDATVKVIFWPAASNAVARQWFNSHRLPAATNSPVTPRFAPRPAPANTQAETGTAADTEMTGT